MNGRGLPYFELKHQAEEFLYEEAELLDQRRFDEWLELFTDDLVYFMPIRRNVKFDEHAAHENTRSKRKNKKIACGALKYTY